MSRTCCIKDCSIVIPHERQMCDAHWKLVPPHLQQDVTKFWRSLRGAIFVKHRLLNENNFNAARDAAIKHVEQTLRPLAFL